MLDVVATIWPMYVLGWVRKFTNVCLAALCPKRGVQWLRTAHLRIVSKFAYFVVDATPVIESGLLGSGVFRLPRRQAIEFAEADRTWRWLLRETAPIPTLSPGVGNEKGQPE